MHILPLEFAKTIAHIPSLACFCIVHDKTVIFKFYILSENKPTNKWKKYTTGLKCNSPNTKNIFYLTLWKKKKSVLNSDIEQPTKNWIEGKKWNTYSKSVNIKDELKSVNQKEVDIWGADRQ